MSEDKIDIIIDRKAFQDDVSFAAKTCQQIVELVKQTKSSIVAVSKASTPKDVIEAMKQTEKLTTDAAKAHKELSTALRQERADMDAAKKALSGVASSLSENIRLQLKYKAELKSVQEDLKKLQAFEGAAMSSTQNKQKYIDQVTTLTKRQHELKAALGEVSQSVKAQSKEAISAEGSYDQMNHVLGQLRNAYRQLSEEERESEIGKELLQNITPLDAKVKAIDASMGNFQRNVGNYSGSMKQSFDALQSELDNVKQKLSGMKEGDAGFDKLNKEAALFDSLLTGLNKEFTSTREEQRAFTEAAKQLGKEFGIASQEFQTFIKVCHQIKMN